MNQTERKIRIAQATEAKTDTIYKLTRTKTGWMVSLGPRGGYVHTTDLELALQFIKQHVQSEGE